MSILSTVLKSAGSGLFGLVTGGTGPLLSFALRWIIPAVLACMLGAGLYWRYIGKPELLAQQNATKAASAKGLDLQHQLDARIADDATALATFKREASAQVKEWQDAYARLLPIIAQQVQESHAAAARLDASNAKLREYAAREAAAASDGGGLSQAASAPSASDGACAEPWRLFGLASDAAVTLAKQADATADTARACQQALAVVAP